MVAESSRSRRGEQGSRVRRGLAALAGVTCLVASVSGQDWGMRKIEVGLTRKIPSVITLTGSTVRIRLDARSQGAVLPQVAEIFRSRLTAEVFRDPRIVEERNTPDAIVEATINDFSWNTRRIEKSSIDLKTRRPTTFYNNLVVGQVIVSYRTLEGREKKGLDSANLRFSFEQEFGQDGVPVKDLFGPKKVQHFKRMPDANEVYQYMVDAIVAQVTRRLVATEETIMAPLPKGRLEAASKLAQAQRWGAMLEAVEKMPAFSAPGDEAFRHYAIGLANEALAYEQADASRAESLLAKAALGYKNAIQRKPDEEPFQVAQTRLSGYPPPSPTPQPRPGPLPPEPGTPPAPGALTNLDVIKLAQEKMSEEFILEEIATAERVEFQTTTDAIVELKRAGVSEKIIRAMRNRKLGAATAVGDGKAVKPSSPQ